MHFGLGKSKQDQSNYGDDITLYHQGGLKAHRQNATPNQLFYNTLDL